MKSILLAIAMLLLLGCSKGDKNFEPLEGFYSLQDVSCECTPSIILPHQQQWYFDFCNSIIEVRTFGDVESHLIFDNGFYNFDFFENGIIETTDSFDLIVINNIEFGFTRHDKFITLSSGLLSGIDDLPDYFFMKN